MKIKEKKQRKQEVIPESNPTSSLSTSRTEMNIFKAEQVKPQIEEMVPQVALIISGRGVSHRCEK